MEVRSQKMSYARQRVPGGARRKKKEARR